MHFWPAEKCAAVTEFLEFPTGKVLNVFAGGGDLIELTKHLEPCFLTWAKVAGCKQIIGYGRPGWERVCKRMGYKHLWTVMAKDVD